MEPAWCRGRLMLASLSSWSADDHLALFAGTGPACARAVVPPPSWPEPVCAGSGPTLGASDRTARAARRWTPMLVAGARDQQVQMHAMAPADSGPVTGTGPAPSGGANRCA